ncbi:hypothetical protein FBD73_15585 (plasmid) [Lacticaseibacillus paracasei]|nr:hypothetical protein FBD73_15585 [Lacticaseibacillus paracasei]
MILKGVVDPFKITGDWGRAPKTKLTISGADIGSIYRKWTSTCKSRDSRKTSKKQNLEFKDLAFYFASDFKNMHQ